MLAHAVAMRTTGKPARLERREFIDPAIVESVKPSEKLNQLDAFAVTAPGLEHLCAAELTALGLRARAIDGGVEWRGTLESVMRANLWSRLASRVLVRVAEFRAKAFFELELNAKKLPWSRFVAPGATVEFRVTCRKSKLYHTDAVAQRFAEALGSAVRDVRIAKAKSEADDESNASVKKPRSAKAAKQLFVVRFLHDVATVSVDASGALLHMRGYRQALAKAPLRETLAAATLLGAGWDGTNPLIDPMCGSGTIPIEAALIARRIAPGRDRSFGFLEWPEVDRDQWSAMLDQAKAGELASSAVRITGSDRDAGAITAAKANAERAGVLNDVELEVRSISAMEPAEGTGLVASNPPYGVRVGEAEKLRDLYAQLGNVLRARRPGWELALLSADRQLERQLRLDLEERLTTRNGGIPVHLVVAAIPAE
jgi:putative N6-adenine-specific DNA methylase